MKYIKTFLFSIALFIGISTVGAMVAHASTANNISGWLWSSNVGWIKLNNCTDPTNAATCTGPDFGVSFAPSGAGGGSGYAWSSNLGWISFNTNSVSSCTTDIDGYSGPCSPYIDWTNPNGDGTRNIKGFARACSVFASGCSGSLKLPEQLGGWDGYIALGDTNAADSTSWGVKLNPSTNVFSGFAWGSDVIGWIDFSGAIFNPSIIGGPTLTLSASPNPVAASGNTTNLTWTVSGATSCTAYDGWSGSKAVSGGTQVSPAITVSPTRFTIMCSDAIGWTTESHVDVTIAGTLPAVTLSASPNPVAASGNTTNLTWTVSGATACTASNGWSGSKSTSGGSQASSGITGSTTFVLACSNANGSSQAQVTVTVAAPSGPQCSDGIDNADPEDTLSDINDPGCHSDGDASNAASYVPSDTDEQDKKKPIFIEF